ncbi:galactose-binding domain-like protein [Protomyces lactucae-debilis]|uniref:Galactose-binding domain-like protein n=1 Tax=Protomyces lactucae-debilis TaxID=2754530 RepID=A0A1Y2F5B0_PROLT|nr:galactose-binding domain-like protein [Protomyces lactucae-debilis]ORY79108.1 galactose-binding domain-like protein [Protomyces lactucae-debilis]
MPHGHVCETEAQHHDHDHDHDHDPQEETHAVQSLYEHIDLGAVRCLNEQSPGSARHIIRPWDKRWDTNPSLQSEEDDAQLLLHVPFQGGQVRPRSLLLRCPRTSSAPKQIKVYNNRTDLDFSSIDDIKPIETIECVDSASAGDIIEYPFKTRLYTHTGALSFLVTSNHAGEEDEVATEIWYLGIRGDFTELHAGPVAVTYEAYANPKDHKVFGGETSGQLGT